MMHLVSHRLLRWRTGAMVADLAMLLAAEAPRRVAAITRWTTRWATSIDGTDHTPSAADVDGSATVAADR